MSELLEEDLIPFAKAIRSLPGRPHISTGYRYLNRGIRGQKLETVLVGGRRFCSQQALRRWIVAVTVAAGGGETVDAGNHVKQDVASRLDREGL